MSKPHFIIAGERRSGSTTLYEILNQHAEVGMFHKPDFDFFIEDALFSKAPISEENIEDWAATHPIEDYIKQFENLQGVTGQKDADLLWWKPAHKRLAEHLPDTKFIIILRNPTKRAESQYFNEFQKGREITSFKEALQREEQSTLTHWQKLHLQYKARGCYVESLEHFFKYIPKERVHVIILEDLFSNYSKVMTEICQFLDINSSKGIAIRPIHSNKEELLVRTSFSNRKGLSWFFNLWDHMSEACIVRLTTNSSKRKKARKYLRGFYYQSNRDALKIDSHIFEELTEFYKPFNRRLEILLNREIPYW